MATRPEKRQVTRDGKTFEQTFHVRSGDVSGAAVGNVRAAAHAQNADDRQWANVRASDGTKELLQHMGISASTAASTVDVSGALNRVHPRQRMPAQPIPARGFAEMVEAGMMSPDEAWVAQELSNDRNLDMSVAVLGVLTTAEAGGAKRLESLAG